MTCTHKAKTQQEKVMSEHTKKPWLYTTGKKPESGESIIVLVDDGSDVYTGVYHDHGDEHPAEVYNEGHTNISSIKFSDYDYWMRFPELNEPLPNQQKIDYNDALTEAQHHISTLEAQLAEFRKIWTHSPAGTRACGND